MWLLIPFRQQNKVRSTFIYKSCQNNEYLGSYFDSLKSSKALKIDIHIWSFGNGRIKTAIKQHSVATNIVPSVPSMVSTTHFFFQTGAQAQLCQGSQGDLRQHQEQPPPCQEACGEAVVLQSQGLERP